MSEPEAQVKALLGIALALVVVALLRAGAPE
jgi:hypothetical protein